MADTEIFRFILSLTSLTITQYLTIAEIQLFYQFYLEKYWKDNSVKETVAYVQITY